MLKRSKPIAVIMTLVFCLGFLAPALFVPQNALAAVKYETLTAPNVSTDDTLRPDLGTVKVSIPDVRVFTSNAAASSIGTALAGVSAGTVYASFLTVGLPSGLEFNDDSIGTAIGATGYYSVESNTTLELYVFGKKTSKTTWDLLVVRGDATVTDGDYSTDFIIPFNSILVKSGSGNIDATFNSSDSAFGQGGTATIAKIGDGATTTMAKSVKTIGDAGGYIDSLILVESMPGVLKDGDKIEFRLPSGFSWSSEGTAWVKGGWGLTGQNNAAVGAGSTAFYLDVDNSDERILTLEVLAAFNPTTSSTTAGRVVIGSDSNNVNSFMKIDVDDTAKFGDIEVAVSCDNNDKVTEQDVLVAKYGDYGVTINEVTKTDVIAGHDTQEVGEFTIEEGIPNSLVANRTVVLELPDGVKWVPGKMPKISATAGDNLFDSDRPFIEVTGTKLRSIKATIDPTADRSKAATLKFKDGEIYVKPGFEGPIEITVSGSAGAEGKVVVANCVKAVSLTTEPAAAPAVIIGEMNQKASDIIITENQKGAILRATDHDTVIIELDPGVSFAKKPTITVEEGNFEIDTYKLINGNNAIQITTKYESTKASKIKISDILLTLNRTVPEGVVKATLAYADGTIDATTPADSDYSGSTALDEAYLLTVNGDKKFSRDSAGDVTIANTITPAVTGASATFKVASNIYNVNGISKVMDAAPYVKNGRTYVPMRYLGYALGLNDDQIVWDQAAQTVTLTKGDVVIVFTIGSTTYTVNGESKTADVAPEIVDGRTMLPARYVAEAFGAVVGWDQASQTVLIEVK